MKEEINVHLKNILETNHLEFTKSAFLIDLIQHDNKSLYVEIVQSILGDEGNTHAIKINSSVLPELIKILQEYQNKINIATQPLHKKVTTVKKNHFTEEQKQEIQRRYLKGISLDEIALQFNQEEKLIEMVLRNRGIEIISEKEYKKQKWKKSNYWRKRRRR